LTSFKEFSLVDDCIDSNCSLSSLTVADDQLTLTTTDRNHGVDSLDTSLKRFVYRLSVDYAGSFALKRHFIEIALNWTFAINWFTKRVDNTSDHTITYLNRSDVTGTANCISFVNTFGVTHQYGTHVIFFKVKHHALQAVFKFKVFPCLCFSQSINTGHAITYS